MRSRIVLQRGHHIGPRRRASRILRMMLHNRSSVHRCRGVEWHSTLQQMRGINVALRPSCTQHAADDDDETEIDDPAGRFSGPALAFYSSASTGDGRELETIRAAVETMSAAVEDRPRNRSTSAMSARIRGVQSRGVLLQSTWRRTSRRLRSQIIG